ncbi:MAG: hypothetical protein ACLP36_16920 [Acidimicrobiales bacterium]
MYRVTDLTELIRHHLVLSTDDVEKADIHLAQLMRNIEDMISTPRWHEPIYWMVCEDCGAWVSSELFGPEGAGECEDGGFCCTECRFADEEP